MLIKRIVLGVMILILSLPAPALAAEPGAGIIEGRLVNGTDGGSSVADQDITLKTYLNDAESGSATTKTNAEGRFVLTGLSTDPKYSYDMTVTFQEADYTSERLTFNAGETTKSTEISVYDSTTSDEAIKIATAHTIIYVGQGSLEVIEFYLFTNESDRTYIGSGEITATGTRRTLSLPLPGKMTELQYGGELMECCVLPGEEGFWDTMPVLPIGKTVAYSYKVDYKSGAYAFSQKVNYPIASYNFLVQGESVGVASDQLVPEGLVEFEGSQFKQLLGNDFAPGNTVVAQLSGLPKSSNQGTIISAALALVVLGVGFGFVYRLRRRSPQPVPVSDRFDQRQQRLLAELAQLDDDFEGGKIVDEVYRRLRAETKRHLVELKRGSKGKSGRR